MLNFCSISAFVVILDRLASVAKVWLLPLVSTDANGPNLPFILNRRSVVQRPQSGHSFVVRRIDSPQVCYADAISV